jgi:aldehyde:ferredoxin oxidoreductase
MAKMIRVDLTQKAIYSEPVPDRYSKLDGRDLTSQIIFNEVDPNCNALGEHNKLVIAPDLLTGSQASNSARLSIGAKSPLTGGIKMSHSSGPVAKKLVDLGITAVVLEGKTEDASWHVLKITKSSVTILPADDIAGLNNSSTVSKLRTVHGLKIGVISIGSGVIKRMREVMTITVTDPEGRTCRHGGRGGLGAVMGSKGVKAVVIDDRGVRRTASGHC